MILALRRKWAELCPVNPIPLEDCYNMSQCPLCKLPTLEYSISRHLHSTFHDICTIHECIHIVRTPKCREISEVYMSICLYVYMSICLYVYMSICLYVYMSLCLYVY